MKRLAFDRNEYQRRFILVIDAARECGIDFLALRTPEHICWISGFNPTGLFYHNQLLIDVASGGAAIVTHRAEERLAIEQSWVEDLLIWHHGEDPTKLAADHIRKHLGQGRSDETLGMNLGGYYQTVEDCDALVDALGGPAIVNVSRMIDDLRLRKSAAEIEVMRQAAALADEGFAAARSVIRPGVTEWEVNAAIQHRLATLGCEYPALPTLVTSGPNSGLFHQLPTNRKLQRGDPVTLEITGVVHRYNTNLVRTVFVGEATDEGRRIYDVVSRAYEAGLALIRPGVPVGEIDRATREARKEFAEFIPARAGFGVELAYPPIWIGSLSILEGDPHVLEPGYVFSLEPSVSGYKDWTIVAGNVVVVTDEGAEVLFKSSLDLQEVG